MWEASTQEILDTNWEEEREGVQAGGWGWGEWRGTWPSSGCDASQIPCSSVQCLLLEELSSARVWGGLHTPGASGISEMVKDEAPWRGVTGLVTSIGVKDPRHWSSSSGVGGWVVLLGQEMVCPTLVSSSVSYSAFWVPESLLKGLYFLWVIWQIYIYIFLLFSNIYHLYICVLGATLIYLMSPRFFTYVSHTLSIWVRWIKMKDVFWTVRRSVVDRMSQNNGCKMCVYFC